MIVAGRRICPEDIEGKQLGIDSSIIATSSSHTVLTKDAGGSLAQSRSKPSTPPALAKEAYKRSLESFHLVLSGNDGVGAWHGPDEY